MFFFNDEPHAGAKHFFAKIGINFSSSLMSFPLGGKNSRVAPAKAVGLYTIHSGPDLETRVSHAIAANTLGIHIANTVFAEKLD